MKIITSGPQAVTLELRKHDLLAQQRKHTWINVNHVFKNHLTERKPLQPGNLLTDPAVFLLTLNYNV